MVTYQILYWHDIPIQVRSGRRRNRVGKELSPRFQIAIDKAAMAANLTGTDAYLDGFVWSDQQERDGTAEEVVTAVIAELEAQHEQIDWRQTATLIRKS
ncbi:MAG: hypothetical protein GY796_11685 [Chloroflexi bacterium]|nr:hypothetical protein [Chloroflexota bacterium]